MLIDSDFIFVYNIEKLRLVIGKLLLLKNKGDINFDFF